MSNGQNKKFKTDCFSSVIREFELAMADVLSKDELRGLKEHKYSSSGKTLFDPVMQIYWEWLVKKVPLWLAPNALRLFGLIVNITTTFILILYSPDGKQEVRYK